jgi:FkbM family methyltransferase
MRTLPPIIPQTESKGYEFNQIGNNGESLLLDHYLEPGLKVFDVGANKGEWSLTALSVERNLEIFAFEPDPTVCKEKLVHNIGPYTKHIFNLAISDLHGTAKFNSAVDENGGGSFYTCPVGDRLKVIHVPVATLDQICMLYRINHIDFLKIDAEGSELNILKGAKILFEIQGINAIQFEYGGDFQRAGISLKDTMLFLTERDFCVFRIIPEGLMHISKWEGNMENFKYCNYFALRQSLAPDYNQVSF